MSEYGVKYRESLIQWIWKTQQFNHRDLRTTSGESIHIEDPGILNHGEGPDFLHARLKIGSMLWHGNIEIHSKEDDWYKHRHQSDDCYNGVVLHVFLEQSYKPAITADGFHPYSLVLNNYLKKPLYRLLLQKKQDGRLPCAGNISVISDEVFHRQIERAHKEYLEYKADQLLLAYPSGKPIPEAWKTALLTVLYETLGMSENRQAMKKLCRHLLNTDQLPGKFSLFLAYVYHTADPGNHTVWSHTGMRPASRPENRIRQAAVLHFEITQFPFREILNYGAATWDEIIHSAGTGHLPGKQMRQILFTTVYLPAQYLLGKLLYSEPLINEAMQLWQNSRTKLSDTILEPFEKSGLPYENYRQKAGLAHQLKRYCRERNCHRCEVFKKTIHS